MGTRTPPVESRIVLFGATGVTGRRTAERLAAAGARPVLAGRDEEALRALSDRLGGLTIRHADAMRRNSVFALVEEGDVLVSTVGPFARWGDAAVRATIAAGATYLDSTGEPAFIRRVFEEFGPAARRAGAALLTAMGYDYVPGALAGALALREAGEAAVRVDVGYYAFGGSVGSLSPGTRLSLVGAALGEQFAFRGGRLVGVRAAERARTFPVRGKERAAVSVGGAEHFTLPAGHPRLREVNVYLGWIGALTRPAQAATLVGSLVTRVPGVRGVLQAAGERVATAVGADDPEPEGVTWVVATAHGADGEQLAEVQLSGDSAYAFTAGFLAWAAQRAAGAGVHGTGAIGPVEAFGLDELEGGCATAGISPVRAL
jgi:short subunit dehydrogenase-like uncharacterized protein